MKTKRVVWRSCVIFIEIVGTLLAALFVWIAASDRLQLMHALNTSREPDLSITKAEVLRNVVQYTAVGMGYATIFGVGLPYWINRVLFKEVGGINERVWAARIAVTCWLIWLAVLGYAAFDCYRRYGAN